MSFFEWEMRHVYRDVDIAFFIILRSPCNNVEDHRYKILTPLI